MIYPLDQQLENLLASFVDEETGEVTVSDAEMTAAIEKLQMDFDEKIKFLRNSCLTAVMNSECFDAEASALYKMSQAKRKLSNTEANKAERIKRFLAYLLQGEKYNKDGVKISYRKSDKLIIDDEEQLRDWAKQNGPGFLKEPELREGDIKTAIKNGAAVPFAHLEQRNNVQVK